MRGSCPFPYKVPMRAAVFLSIFLGFWALMAAGFAAVAQPYGGAPYGGPPDGRPPQYQGAVQPLDRILPGIRRTHPGQFYDADGPTWGPDGNPHYHLKWLTPDGRVLWFDADARSGRVLRASPGRDSFDGPGEDGPPPPGYARPYDERGAPGGYGRAYPYTPRFVPGPRYGRPFGGWHGGGGGRRRH
jgi:hypothetical protein